MKRIPFSELEFARRDPRGFAKALSAQVPGQSTGRFSKSMAWQLAVYHFHKEKDDLQSALDYFEKMFQKNFVSNPANKVEYDRLVSLLHNYVKDHAKNKLIYIEHKKRISIPINSKIKLGGELPLIKMNQDGGYSIYFFSKNQKWKEELKFPIVQYYAASVLFNEKLSNIQIGIYNLEKNKHMQVSFNEDEVDQALKELIQVGSSLSLLI